MLESPDEIPSHAESIGESGTRRGAFASIAAIGAAFLASLCCIGPILFVTLGIGAGLASQFEPLRPVFIVLTMGLLALGFYSVYGRRPAVDADASCSVENSCAAPRNRTRDKVILWIAAAVVLIVLTFPQWSMLLI
jgi:mercuric ion transport protein